MINIQTIDPRLVVTERWVRCLKTVHGQRLLIVGVLSPTKGVEGHRAREYLTV